MSAANEAILLYALRYALGRRTFAPLDVQEAVRAAMPIRDAGVLAAMIRDIEEARRLATNGGHFVNALGDRVIDAPGWLRLLADLKAAPESENSREASPQKEDDA